MDLGLDFLRLLEVSRYPPTFVTLTRKSPLPGGPMCYLGVDRYAIFQWGSCRAAGPGAQMPGTRDGREELRAAHESRDRGRRPGTAPQLKGF